LLIILLTFHVSVGLYITCHVLTRFLSRYKTRFSKIVKIISMSTRYLNVCHFCDQHGLIIHCIDDDLYRVIRFEFDYNSNVYSWPEVTTIEATNIVDLYLRRDGWEIILESVNDAENKLTVHNMIHHFKNRINTLSWLQRTMSQMQRKRYQVRLVHVPSCECYDDTVYKVSVYSARRKIAEGEYMEFDENRAQLTIYNKNLPQEEYVTMVLHILETVRQTVCDNFVYDFRTSVEINPIKPSMIRKGDLVLERPGCSVNQVILYRNVKSIDLQSREIRFAGEPYAEITVELKTNKYNIMLINERKPIDMDVLAPYLL